jgi:hypothetical protein
MVKMRGRDVELVGDVDGAVLDAALAISQATSQ